MTSSTTKVAAPEGADLKAYPFVETPVGEIPGRVKAARAAFAAGRLATLGQRKQALLRLIDFLDDHAETLHAALRKDLHKHPVEAELTEIGITKAAVIDLLANIDAWSADEYQARGAAFLTDSVRIQHQPLGTVLVVGPWNYPVQLMIVPVASAIAAGNTVVIKCSEVAPAVAGVICHILPDYLGHEILQTVQGGVAETTALLQERFDHIFYTGAGAVGKVMMRAAAEHLTPVTLELGGKSPVFIDETADLEMAARRLLWGKFVNAGQTCVAPDYILAPPALVPKLVAQFQRAAEGYFGSADPADWQSFPDYARIINGRHWTRLTKLLSATKEESGVEVALGGVTDEADLFIAPTVLTGVKPGSAIMMDEIFGPLLPILTFESTEEAIEHVNRGDTPLALYIFSGSSSRTEQILRGTTSGGVCINDVIMHLTVPNLPFGGKGASGMGAYHGKHSFDTFTHRRAVLDRDTTFLAEKINRIRSPPYIPGALTVFRSLIVGSKPSAFRMAMWRLCAALKTTKPLPWWILRILFFGALIIATAFIARAI